MFITVKHVTIYMYYEVNILMRFYAIQI